MNICLVTTEYPPGPMGGIGTYSMILPQMLIERGHQVTIITKTSKGAKSYSKEDSIHVYRLDHFYEEKSSEASEEDQMFTTEMHHVRNYTGIFARNVQRKLRSLHEKHSFDIVLTQELEAPCFMAQDRRVLFNELADLPFVIFLHSPHSQIQEFNEDRLYNRSEYHRVLYESQSIAMADGLIAASDFMKGKMIEELGMSDKSIRTIPLPTGEIPEPADFSKRKGSTGSKEKRIVYSGRIELRKGLDVLIRSVLPILERDPNVSLHLFGRDCEHPPLGKEVGQLFHNKYVPRKFRDRVILEGAVPRKELWKEYSEATVGVVPSLWEPFSFSCQEMMACATPVVATDQGGMAEMIEDGKSGLICEANNVEALTTTLEKALYADEDTRKAWGDAAATRIRSFCDNNQIIQSTINYLEETIENSRKKFEENRRFKIPSNLPFSDIPLALAHPKSRSEWKPVKKVTAVVPCYNMGAYLDETIDSLLEQSFENLDILIIDDGSNDEDTINLLDSYTEHKRVKVERYVNGGLPVARHRGALSAIESACDAMIFIDADDLIDSTYVEKAVEVMNRHPETGAVTAWTESFGRMQTYWAPPHGQFPFMLTECMSTPPALVRTEVYQETGGASAEMKYAYEDWEFWISLCRLGYAMLIIPEPLIKYRMRVGSMAHMYNEATREHGRIKMLQRHETLFERFAIKTLLLSEGFNLDASKELNIKIDGLKKEKKALDKDLQWNLNECNHIEKKYIEKSQEFDELQKKITPLNEEIAWLRDVVKDLENERDSLNESLKQNS